MVNIIQNRNKFFILSGILVIASLAALIVWGLKLGIDFTGGSLLEVQVKSKQIKLTAQDVTDILQKNVSQIGEVRTQPTADGFLIRMKDLSEKKHQAVLEALKKPNVIPESLQKRLKGQNLHFTQDDIIEKRFESIGPVIGKELKNKAIWAISLAIIVIILYIAWAFRKVSKPVASWKYGIGAIIALAHDILIVIGVFVVLGHFLNFEVGILFVTALLTILGYSVNDTIVVYDRTRENLIYNPQETFEATVNKSVNETISRSINTSLTTLLVLFALYFLGGTTIKNFVLALIIGIISGTYSSIFIASPLLVVWQRLRRK